MDHGWKEIEYQENSAITHSTQLYFEIEAQLFGPMGLHLFLDCFTAKLQLSHQSMNQGKQKTL